MSEFQGPDGVVSRYETDGTRITKYRVSWEDLDVLRRKTVIKADSLKNRNLSFFINPEYLLERQEANEESFQRQVKRARRLWLKRVRRQWGVSAIRKLSNKIDPVSYLLLLGGVQFDPAARGS